MSSKEQNNSEEQALQESEIKNEQQKKEQPIEITAEIPNILDPRDERINELETLLIQAQIHERDYTLRAKAEIENIRRRSEKDIEKAHKFALEHFSSALLPVIDNLERALDMLDRSNNELASTIEGIELTLKSLLDVIHKFGLEVVKDTHVPFNPEIHQAMQILESDKHEPNIVITVIQKGYTLNGRLIRPAMVTVSKAKNQEN